jgi:hypothetical protein
MATINRRCPWCQVEYYDVFKHARLEHVDEEDILQKTKDLGGVLCGCGKMYANKRGLSVHHSRFKCKSTDTDTNPRTDQGHDQGEANTQGSTERITREAWNATQQSARQDTHELFENEGIICEVLSEEKDREGPSSGQAQDLNPNAALLSGEQTTNNDQAQEGANTITSQGETPLCTNTIYTYTQLTSLSDETIVDIVAGLPKPMTRTSSRIDKDFGWTVKRLSKEYLRRPGRESLLPILLLPSVGLAPEATMKKVGVQRKRLREYPNPHLLVPGKQVRSKRGDGLTEEIPLARRQKEAVKLIQMGKVGRAQRALTQAGTIAPICAETLSALQDLHPDGQSTPFKNNGTRGPKVLRGTVLKAIGSFKIDSAGGLLGWNVPLLRQAAKIPEFVEALAMLSNRIANNTAECRQILTTSCLTPLKKVSGGIRPIAVGDLIYRTAMKSILKVGRQEGDLADIQLGVGSKGGVEPVIHMVRLAAEEDQIEGVGLFDFRNAFNNVDRVTMAKAVRKYNKPMYKTFKWAYDKPSIILVRGGEESHKLLSKQGVRQGDPLGPYGFSLAIRPVVEKLEETTDARMLFYLDDLTATCPTRGSYDAIAEELQKWRGQGLDLNLDKSEFVPLNQIQSVGIDLLGSHVGSRSSTRDFLKKRIAGLKEHVEALNGLPIQHAFCLLRLSTSREIAHLARTTPPEWVEDLWLSHDEIIWSELSRMRNYRSSEDTTGRMLTFLPIRRGGFGLPSMEAHSKPAWEAATETSEAILRGETELEDIEPQRSRSLEIYDQQVEDLRARLSAKEKSLYIEQCSVGGSAWVSIIPEEKNLRIADNVFVRAMRSRSMVNVSCGKETCPACFITADSSHHERCAQSGTNRLLRHESIKHVLAEALREAGSIVEVEPMVNAEGAIFRLDLRVEGKHAVLGDVNFVDVSLVSCKPVENATWSEAASNVWGQLEARYKTKMTKYERKLEYLLLPFVMSTGGLFHPGTWSWLTHMEATGVNTKRMLRRISVALMNWKYRAYGKCVSLTL